MMAFLLIGMAAADADAKVTYQAGSVKDDNKLNQYQDSLAIYKARLDSIQTLQKAYTAFDKYRLFTSSTFYNDVAQQKLGLNTEMKDSVSQEIDNALMNIYLKHPELIRVSEAEITEAGAVNQQITKPIVNTEKLVEKAPEAAVETVEAPEPEVVVKKPNFWTFKGDYAVQFLQNYVSGNWHKGGESNYSALASAVLEANYNNKQKVKWDNKLELKLGLQNLRSDSVHSVKSTEDLIRFTSKLGLQASKRWYYTLQLLAQSQFTHSYKTNDPVVYSDFLAPLKVNLSVGMDYNVDWLKHKLKGTFHLAPAAYNMQYTRLMELSDRLGLEGKRVLHDYGSQFTVDLTWELSELIKWKTRMYGFTTYKRVEYEWENTFVFQLNKWLSAQLFIYPRFDDAVTRDSHHGYWQYQEFSSIGLTYSF